MAVFQFGEKKRIFRDIAQHEKLWRDGYVPTPFLDKGQLAEVRALFERLHPDGVKGFFTTTFSLDREYRYEVDSEIRRIAMPSIERLFQDYKLYCGSFIVKEPGPKSELILHQDMSLVDESIFTGMNIWCPLVDLTTENGAIEVLPRSHRLFPTYRGASLPDIYDGMEKEVKSYLEVLYLKAGTAVVFDQSIIHYSPPNRSNEIRPVINIFITHQEAQIQIAFRNAEKYGPDKVEVFRQQDDFMMEFRNFGTDIFSRPSIGESLGLFDFDFPKLTLEKLEAEYGPCKVRREPEAVAQAAKPGLLQRIGKLWGR